MSHQSRNEVIPTRGAVASPRDYNRSHPRLRLFPCSCYPRSRHLQTTPNPCRTCLGSTRRYRNDVREDGKGSFDERRSMRKRIYDKKGGCGRGWLKRETAKRVRLGERTSLDKRAAAVQEKDETRFIRYGKTKLVGTTKECRYICIIYIKYMCESKCMIYIYIKIINHMIINTTHIII